MNARAALAWSAVLAAVLAACVSSSTTGDSGSSSSSGGSGNASSGGGSSSGSNPRQCGADVCMFSEACVNTPDGSACAPYCDVDGGCAGTLVCRAYGADGGIKACTAAGELGDPCGGALACQGSLVCAQPVDAGASCRRPCTTVADDAGVRLSCASPEVCFVTHDGGAGACFPR